MALYTKTHNPKDIPESGDLKIKRKIIWYPKTLRYYEDGKSLSSWIYQTRWLGIETIIYRYSYESILTKTGHIVNEWKWVPWAWDRWEKV